MFHLSTWALPLWGIMGLLIFSNGCFQPLRGPGSMLSSNIVGAPADPTAQAAGLDAESFHLQRGQLVFHTNFYLPPTHPLIEDVVALRTDMFRTLRCEPGTEPIHVYLYRSPQDLARIVRQTGDPIQQRRAYFLQTADTLKVYASWTYDIGIDLRHELAHGYLHSVRHHVPLWLDEGLAEYFEVLRPDLGNHPDHVKHLAHLLRTGPLNLDLERLEKLSDPATFEQTDYAVSWLWVSFLLSRPDTSDVLAKYFQALPADSSALPPLSTQLKDSTSVTTGLVRDYLEQLITKTRGEFP